MIRTLSLIGFSSLLLTACDGGNQDAYISGPPSAPAPMRASPELNDTIQVTGARLSQPSAPASSQTPPQADGPLLAYAYNTVLSLPASHLAETHDRHVQACQSAGHAVCQVVRSNVANADSAYPSANLQLRATPAWIAEFRGGLSEETQSLGGSIQSDQTSVEDLTVRIVDGEARLRAQTTLRDRLQTLLETRNGDLGDLLQVERELAQVQANLDSQASVLAALRQRVETSSLNLTYQATRQIVEPEDFNPISEAFKEMGSVFAGSVASLILFLAGALPWLVIAVPVISGVIMGFRRLLRRRKAKS